MAEGMSEFVVVPLGVGDAFSAKYYSTCMALHAEGTWVLVDCPHPIRKILRESGTTAGLALDVGQFSGIFLTHLHADHASGLEGFGFYSFFAVGQRTRVLTHPDVRRRLWDGHLAGGMETSLSPDAKSLVARRLTDYFEVIDLSESKPVQFGPFKVECRRTIHHIPTFGLRITAAGRCLGYSADTMFDPGLIEWLAPADLIIHETNEGTHTPYEKLVTLPRELLARMRIIHYPDDFDLAASQIEPLHQGVVVRV
jgi:ribonuclease BN (tRNA processing enzyme)